LDYSHFEVWVIVCDAPLNFVIGELHFRNNIKGNWKCISLFVKCKDFFKKCSFVMRFMARESISNDIAFARKVDNVWTIFLNNQLPVSDAISSEVQKGKILVIGVNRNQMSEKSTLVLMKCFHYHKQFEFCDGVSHLRISKFP
jgi:hypothetical protein